MCGIIGYTGKAQASGILIDGLKALEYRGYDSAGVAICEAGGDIRVIKKRGRVAELEASVTALAPNGSCGIGHTRWATHGAPTENNAHPHASGSLVLVHNGIIDNCLPLRAELEALGYVFSSETDTECAAHLTDLEYRKDRDPVRAIFRAAARLTGSYAFAIMFGDLPGEIFCIRRDNPLVVAATDDGAFVASDVPALLPYTRKMIRPPEDSVVHVTANGVTLFYRDGRSDAGREVLIDVESGTAQKDGYDHFMLKEIHEQPDALRRVTSHRMDARGLPDFTPDGIEDDFWLSADNIEIVACGSATHAGLVGKYLIEKLAGVPVSVNTASEYRYDPPATIGKAVVLAISQSGETADTLAALRSAKSRGLHSAAIINAVGSAIAREADYVMYTNAGPEIAVATTKGYSTQVALLALIAAKLACLRKTMDYEQAASFCRALAFDIPRAVSDVISRRDEIKKISEKIYNTSDLYFIGRGPDCPAGTECSLKMKEISYVHSEAYAAGELKHGTLSLIEKGTPVIALATDSGYYDKMAGNIREVRARGGYSILVCCPDFEHPEAYGDEVFVLPRLPALLSPLVSVVFAQLLSYEVAIMRGCDVDHPRNLAKSVTVE